MTGRREKTIWLLPPEETTKECNIAALYYQNTIYVGDESRPHTWFMVAVTKDGLHLSRDAFDVWPVCAADQLVFTRLSLSMFHLLIDGRLAKWTRQQGIDDGDGVGTYVTSSKKKEQVVVPFSLAGVLESLSKQLDPTRKSE